MAGLILPAYGGAWIPDTGGGGYDVGGRGHLPTGLMEMLEIFGQNGIEISGVVTWIGAQIDTQTTDAWKALAERSIKDLSTIWQFMAPATGPFWQFMAPETAPFW